MSFLLFGLNDAQKKAFPERKACVYLEHALLHTFPVENLLRDPLYMFYFLHSLTKVG